MKCYYYFLFRIFSALSDPRKKNDATTITILLTNTSTLIVCFVIYTLLLYFDNYFFNISNMILPNKTAVLASFVVIAFLNYMFFIKPKRFLNYNFKPDKKGGYTLVAFIVFLAMTFVFVANKNRDKIFKQNKEIIILKKTS